MKKMVVTFAALIVPALSYSFEHEPFSWREVRERSTQTPAPAAAAAGAATLAVPAAASAPNMLGATVGRGVFASDYEVKAGDQKLGAILQREGGYVYMSAQGGVIATARGGVVNDGAGKKLGTIAEGYSDECSTYVLYDAAGAKAAETGCLDGSSFDVVLAGEPRVIVKNDHWFKDRFKVTALDSRVDGRLVAILIVMHNESNYRRASARQRERNMDRPGRGDRAGYYQGGGMCQQGPCYGYNGPYGPNGPYNRGY